MIIRVVAELTGNYPLWLITVIADYLKHDAMHGNMNYGNMRV